MFFLSLWRFIYVSGQYHFLSAKISNISCNAAVLTANSLIFCLSGKFFISLSILNNNLFFFTYAAIDWWKYFCRTEWRTRSERKWGQFKRPLKQCQMQQHLHYRGPRRRRNIERDWEIFEEIIVEKFPNMGKETIIQV